MPVTVPTTTTITSHGLLIQARGEVIGAITRWRTNENRTITPVFEFGGVTTGAGDDIQGDSGEPYENVPGNIGGTTIGIQRYDIYTKRFENAFGTNNLEMLTKQTSSIRFVEFITAPDGTAAFQKIYYGAWFNRKGREYAADGPRVVMADAEATYTRSRDV